MSADAPPRRPLYCPLKGGVMRPSPAPQVPPAFLAELHRLFVDACRCDLVDLRAALNSGQRTLAQHHAHRMHGAALSVGALDLARHCCEMERRLESGEPFIDADQLFEQITRALGDWHKGHAAGL